MKRRVFDNDILGNSRIEMKDKFKGVKEKYQSIVIFYRAVNHLCYIHHFLSINIFSKAHMLWN